MTEIRAKNTVCKGIKFYAEKDSKEIARAYLYVMRNDLHAEPFGLMEDVFVSEELRGQGVGSDLVRRVIEAAKELGCYKLICTSRHEKPKVHELYQRLGFKNHGNEFRIDF